MTIQLAIGITKVVALSGLSLVFLACGIAAMRFALGLIRFPKK